jgi:hypothetical protein
LSRVHKSKPGNTSGKTAGAIVRALGKPATEAEPLDPALARILDAWPALPEAIRRAMLALVESASTR